MKTVSCDICGKTTEQLFQEGKRDHISRYTKTRNSRWWVFENPVVDEFDICDNCLYEIRNARLKGGESDDLE